MPLTRNFRSMVLYFVLNLFVTFTNRQILTASNEGSLERPYLLTATHAIASFSGCLVVNHFRGISSLPASSSTPHPVIRSLSWRQHTGLAAFSLFYTLNITLSNLSLSLVSLVLNQTIRATAPVLTVVVSALLLGRSFKTYSFSTYISLVPITTGVLLATTSIGSISGNPHFNLSDSHLHFSSHQPCSIGIILTFMSALTAVLKTILTHKLMTSLSLKLSSIDLLQILSPYAAVQALSFAYLNGELSIQSLSPSIVAASNTSNNDTIYITRRHPSLIIGHYRELHSTFHAGTMALWLSNATAAFLLNLTSFTANKVCGPVSMAVAANLKQVVVLVMPVISAGMGLTIAGADGTSRRVVIGAILMIAGGILYATNTVEDSVKKDGPQVTVLEKREN